MDKDDIKLAVTSINGITNLFSRALSVYENSKKLEFEMKQLSVKKEIYNKELSLRKLTIEKAYQDFEKKCKLIEEILSHIDKQGKVVEGNVDHWRKQSDRLLSRILKFKGEDNNIEVFIKLWERTQLSIEKSMADRMNFMNDRLSEASRSAISFLEKTPNNFVGSLT